MTTTTPPLGHPLATAAAVSSSLADAAPISTATVRTGWFTPAALAFAALSLGLALQVNFGQYHPAAMPWLTVALLATLAAAALPNFGRLSVLNWRPDQLVLAVALAVQFALLYSRDPAATLRLGTPDELLPFKAGVALAAALTAVGVSGTRAARAAVPLLLLTHLALGVWVIRVSAPIPVVDVQVFQRDAADALLAGHNPYAMTFPDVYDGRLTALYGPGLTADGRLHFGYPYLPLSLFLALPGHALGDFRYAHLLALTLAGALIAYARPRVADWETRGQGDKETGGGREAAPREASADTAAHRLCGTRRPGVRGPLVPLSPCPLVSSPSPPPARAVAAAALLLFTPSGFFVVEAGWTEPFAILMLAATVFVACRRGRRWAVLLPVALGLLLACKQYIVLAAPLALLLPVSADGVSRPAWRRARVGVFALLIAAAVTLPMVLWDIDAFVHSAVTLQFRQPFRADSLSYLVPLALSSQGATGTSAAGAPLPAWTCFAAAGTAALLALWRCPRTAAGFATGVALVFFAFFATSKQAFCNYYAFVLAALCCALAAFPGSPPAHPRRP